MTDERPLTAPEYLALERYRILVKKLREDPVTVLDRARHNIVLLRQMDTNGNGEYYFAAWEKLINGPQPELEEAMTSTSQVSRDLRQAGPFAGTITPDENWDLLERVYRDQHPDASPETLERIHRMRPDSYQQPDLA